MAGLLGWIENSTSRLLDPQREVRVGQAASYLERELASECGSFSLGVALRQLNLFAERRSTRHPANLPLVPLPRLARR